MAAWGPAILADDLASDVCDLYRQLVADGIAGTDATNQLLRIFRDAVSDEEEGPVFWLALAATQWKVGRLEDRVKSEAIKVMEDGTALRRWAAEGTPRAISQRQSALSQLREQIRSPQPAVKKLRPVALTDCPWAIGTILHYRMASGQGVLFHLVGKDSGTRGMLPIFAILDWQGLTVPSFDVICDLLHRKYRGGTATYEIALMRKTKKDTPGDRLIETGFRRKAYRRRKGEGFAIEFWQDLDQRLFDEFWRVYKPAEPGAADGGA